MPQRGLSGEKWPEMLNIVEVGRLLVRLDFVTLGHQT
jgi:hypothetical protein